VLNKWQQEIRRDAKVTFAN